MSLMLGDSSQVWLPGGGEVLWDRRASQVLDWRRGLRTAGRRSGRSRGTPPPSRLQPGLGRQSVRLVSFLNGFCTCGKKRVSHTSDP